MGLYNCHSRLIDWDIRGLLSHVNFSGLERVASWVRKLDELNFPNQQNPHASSILQMLGLFFWATTQLISLQDDKVLFHCHGHNKKRRVKRMPLSHLLRIQCTWWDSLRSNLEELKLLWTVHVSNKLHLLLYQWFYSHSVHEGIINVLRHSFCLSWKWRTCFWCFDIIFLPNLTVLKLQFIKIKIKTIANPFYPLFCQIVFLRSTWSLWR